MSPLEQYLTDMRDIHNTGAAVEETAYYGALCNLLNEVGKKLKPKVRCIIGVRNQGAGLPDGGFFTPEQLKKSSQPVPMFGDLSGAEIPKHDTGGVFQEIPSRGAMEVKGPADDVLRIVETQQVRDYLARYGIVLVTNYRDFVLAEDGRGGPAVLHERYTLAETETEFWKQVQTPRKTAEIHEERLTQYLARVMLRNAPLVEPRDLAWFLASYARDAKARIEQAADLDALNSVRAALEEALGLRFEDEKGEHFFRSTLVQTLFYGLFSAWVLWSKSEGRKPGASFNWRVAQWSLHVPMIKALYEQVSAPSKLGPLGLEQVMNWAGEVLDRVDRDAFFAKFQEEHAVQYFYEPFLEAFDPELRKQLGVWYTPPEIVQYMVERVDRVLREELDIADGLADENVYVLDPCCGTGAYLVETLRRIEKTLKARGEDALIPQDLKKAMTSRVFGFEILPAPFVVAHLQLGLMLQNLGAPLSDDRNERAGVYLTNALTGWEPAKEPKTQIPLWAELQQEREAADKIKQDTPILVILGNPPYNGYAGVAVDEERELSEAYRTTERAAAPQGQGLNDLYVRFYRMAERRITEGTGRGIVCFISNYSWLDGLSFTGMRERYLQVFDRIWIDCLNGDKYKTGKLTPQGDPDPSVFSTEWSREGIQVGTAIGLLTRRSASSGCSEVAFRHFWGTTKRQDLLASAGDPYEACTPVTELGLPFVPMVAQAAYLTWPLLPDLFPVSFPGVKTSRDDVLVEIDRDDLVKRMERYFDTSISHEELRRQYPSLMENASRFDAISVRDHLLRRGFLRNNVVRYCYRPFDVRWLYWEPETKLLDEKRAEYFPHVSETNTFLFATGRTRKNLTEPSLTTALLLDLNCMDSGARGFPLLLRADAQSLFCMADEASDGCNLTSSARAYLSAVDADGRALLMHANSTLHSPAYREENTDAIRGNWPRIPLPNSRDLLLASAELGKQIAALLDTEKDVPGVTSGNIRPELADIGVVSVVPGAKPDLDGEGLAVTAGWGHAGQGGVTMPGKGRFVERTSPLPPLPAGEGKTLDVYLNDQVYWKNIPRRVWDYHIGGYQVIKKWLSYRERTLLGRPLRPEEAREVMNIARRIAAIILLEPELDENYRKVKADTYAWPTG